MDPAEDVRRNKDFLKHQVHKLARVMTIWQICQDAFRIMKEGTADEMEQHIAKLMQEARQQRNAGRQECQS